MDTNMADEQDTYVSQLREVFDSCDDSGTGYLSKDALFDLCEKLQLHDQTAFFVKRLLQDEPDARVDFSEFKECFVSLLTQTVNNAAEYSVDSDLNNPKSASDREVSPKFVLGQKKYGRRSRPESSTADTDNDAQSDFSEADVLSVSYLPHDSVNIELTDSVFQNQNEATPPVTPSRSKLLLNSSLCRTESNRSIPSSIDQKSETYEMEELDSELADSDISSTYHGDNEEQYLRGIWRKLGVGKGGYLDLQELTIVCQHIGMDKMPDEVVKQLFEKLDSDQDGKVSFEEFLQGLFQHGFSPGSPENSSVFSEVCSLSASENRKQSVRRFSVDAQDERKGSVSGVMVSYCGIFSVIDPDNNGFANAKALCELWESLGLTGGLHLLRELGFNTSLKINLQDLTDILEEELQSKQHTKVYRYAVVSYLNEMQHVKSNFEQVKTERDKLKGDLSDANSRAAILAQEVDDHHAKLEQSSQNKIMYLDKKYQDQIKDLQTELERERDKVAAHEVGLRQQLSGEIETIREDDAKIREELAYVTKENSRLEQELADLLEKHEEVERLNSLHHKELDSLAELRQRMVDMESGRDYLQDQQYQTLMDELENGREEIQEMKDRNDELSMEVESLRRELATCERPLKRHKRNGSWLADYTKLSPTSSLKRRESGSSTEDGICNSDEDSPVAGKMRRRILLSPINQDRLSIEVETLEEQHKEEIERLTSEFERAIVDLQDSYDVQLVKLNAQLSQAISRNGETEKNDSMTEIHKLSSELMNVKQQLVQQSNLLIEEKESYEEVISKLKLEIENDQMILETSEKNHLLDKNELLTRLEQECNERMEQAQFEWYQRLEELRQESGDELEAGLQNERRVKKHDERLSGSELLKQLEEQKLLMMRKYKNLKSQLRVTTEELEMALAREAQAEELHVHLQKRCLKVEERLIQMASGIDTGSETSTEFATTLSNEDQQGRNRPNEVIVSENTQLKRRNALLVTRCEVLERSLHAAKAREYFGEAYVADAKEEKKTDDELEKTELNRKIENLEAKLQLSQHEVQMCKLETDKYWQECLEEEKKNVSKISSDFTIQCHDLEQKIVQLQKENSELKKICDESTSNDVLVKGVEGLSGQLRKDFERLVGSQVHDMWQQMLLGGEAALSGQLKEDFNSMLSNAVHKVEETLRNHYNEDREHIQNSYNEENNKIRSEVRKEKRIMKSEYEDKLHKLTKPDIDDDEPNRTDILLKDMFVENAKLVKALQITEERQMKAEQFNLRLQKKCRMLSKVLSDVTRAAVS